MRNEALIALTEEEASRFWEKVNKESGGGCWSWTGYLNFGYGRFRLQGKHWRAHRLAYSITVGRIPDGKVTDHLCRNRSCVNPEHLEIVDSRTNTLRGESPIAKQARQTHCKRGHELSEGNLYPTKTGYRMCRACESRSGFCPDCGKELRQANVLRHRKELHGYQGK